MPEPKKVFEIFSELSKIPRGSGNTKKATLFCVDYAKKLGLDYKTDKAGNVIIYKNGSKGYENHSAVILQGHLDMVCEKTAEKVINFETEGLTLLTDGEFLFADGTTLGADDGIAVAIILALLSDNSLSHPPIEAIFTTDEETGMDGARALDTSVLKGKTMINLDSEDEHTLWVSCAGGARADIDIPVKRVAKKYKNTYRVTLKNLCGGHSGTEIDKGRINAVKALSAFLSSLPDIELFEFNGGLMDNAIPREATAVIGTDNVLKIREKAEYFEKLLKEKHPSENELSITVNDCSTQLSPLSFESFKNILGFINESQNGVISMSEKIKGLVETSLNLGIMKLYESKIHISFSLRSSVNAEKEKLYVTLSECAENHNGSFSVHSEYPAWEYNEVSPLREVFSKEYEKVYNKKSELRAIHAGLECGIFYNKIKDLDCVSFGPDILDIHTPEEKLSLLSVKHVYSLVKNVLKEL